MSQSAPLKPAQPGNALPAPAASRAPARTIRAKARKSSVMAADLRERKPMVQAKKVSFFHRQIFTNLSSAAIEILFGQAQILSEGDVAGGGYFGSTMITIDCTEAKGWVSDPCDGTTVRQIGELLLQDPRFRDKARNLAEKEAQRLAQLSLGPAQIEMRLRTTGKLLHLDIDVEAEAKRTRAS